MEDVTRLVSIVSDERGVEVGMDIRNYSELRLAVTGLLSTILKLSTNFEEEIKKETGRKYKGNLKVAFVDILHNWVDELYEEDEELRQIRQC